MYNRVTIQSLLSKYCSEQFFLSYGMNVESVRSHRVTVRLFSMFIQIRRLQRVIVQADVLIGAILHTEAARNRAKLYKSESFIQMSGMYIGGYDRIKLQHPEAMLFSFQETI